MLFNICDNYYNKEDEDFEKENEKIIKSEVIVENDENECFICYENNFDKIIC